MYVINILWMGRTFELLIKNLEHAAFLMQTFEQGGSIQFAPDLMQILQRKWVQPNEVTILSVGFDPNHLDLEDAANNNLYR